MINSSRANFSLDLLSFFLQNDSLLFSSTSSFHPCISSVYFNVRRGDLLNLPKFYRASSVFWRAPTGKWQWLTDQSERAIYFCCYNTCLLAAGFHVGSPFVRQSRLSCQFLFFFFDRNTFVTSHLEMPFYGQSACFHAKISNFSMILIDISMILTALQCGHLDMSLQCS